MSGTDNPGKPGDQPGTVSTPSGTGSIPDRDYDNMPLSRLREIAEGKGVSLLPDVEKSHLITQLRAHDSGTGE